MLECAVSFSVHSGCAWAGSGGRSTCLRPVAYGRVTGGSFVSHLKAIRCVACIVLTAGAQWRADAAVPGDAQHLDEGVQRRIGTASYSIQQLSIRAVGSGASEASIVLDGRMHHLRVRAAPVRVPGFRVGAQGPDGRVREVAPPSGVPCRGELVGPDGCELVGYVLNGRMRLHAIEGSDPLGRWSIEPAGETDGSEADHYVVYRSPPDAMPPAVCATPPATRPQLAGGGSDGLSFVPLEAALCEIACDADYEYYKLNGASIEQTVADIETIISGTSAIYERDLRLSLAITHIIVRTAEPDPYTTANSHALLDQFRSQWTAQHGDVPRDVAHLFTGKALTVGIGIAYEGSGICSSYLGYSIVRSRYSTDMARRIVYSAHELGHNLDGDHCDYVEPWCRIMCPTVGGCSGGLRSFDPWTVNRMRAFLATRTCLSPGEVSVPATSVPFLEKFANGPLDPVRWTAIDDAYGQPDGAMTLNVGRGSSLEFQTFGTARTLPMKVSRPCRICYRTRPIGVPAGHVLKIEYFNSSLYQWQLLNTVPTTGGTPAGFTSHEHAMPADGYGDYFALRFTGYHNRAVTPAYSWRIDDVAVTPSVPADFDNDGDLDGGDYARFEACMSGPSVPQGDPACLPADLDEDGDVDQSDFGTFQVCYSGTGRPAELSCGD